MNRKQSFFQKNALSFLIYVVGILVAMGIVYIAFDILSEMSMRRYLENTYLEVPQTIIEGNYDHFSGSKLDDGFIEVYNEMGEIIYPKSSKAQFDVIELQYIPNEFKRPIVNIVNFEDFKGNNFKEITFEYYTELHKSGFDVLLIDDDRKVAYTTFEKMDKQLTARVVDILTGNLNEEYEISKEDFINTKGGIFDSCIFSQV